MTCTFIAVARCGSAISDSCVVHTRWCCTTFSYISGFTVQCVTEQWIGQVGPTAWFATSADLNLLAFYLLGYLQSAVCATEFNDIQDFQ
jgi:hypothetical protein